MPVKDIKRFALGCCIAAVLAATGCHSPEQLMNPSLSLKTRQSGDPKFLDNISLAGNSSNIKINVVTAMKERKDGDMSPSACNILQTKYSEILGVIPQAITNMPLYGFIDDWYGVRYRLGGNDRGGIDCSGFVQRLYESVFCMNLMRTAFEQFHKCSMVFKSDSLQEGDLVFFKTRGRRISHVGIYLVNDFFVHASSTQGVVISSLKEKYWSRLYAGAGQVPGVEHGL